MTPNATRLRPRLAAALVTSLALAALGDRASAVPAPAPGRAVAIVLGAHPAYTFDPGNGAPVPYGAARDGALALLDGLGAGDRVAVYRYGERGAERIAAWSSPREAAAALRAAKAPEAGGSMAPPALAKALEAVAADVEAAGAKLPGDRAVLLVTDGKDVSPAGAAMDRAAAGVEKALGAARARLDVVGLTLDVAEPLLAWEDLSRRTGGRAARPEVDDALVAFREAIPAIEAAPAAAPKPARALAVVLSATPGFLWEENQVESQYASSVRGAQVLVKQLGADTLVAVWRVDGQGAERLVSWRTPAEAARALDAASSPGDRPSAAAAATFAAVESVFAAVAADATLPATRAALVVTDGKDAAQDDPKAIAARQASLAAAAKQARLTMGLVGFSLDVVEPLAPWEAVAKGTGGPVERAVELGAGGLAVIRVGKALTR